MTSDTASPGGTAFDQLDEKLDDVFDALAHAYRRFALVYLAGENGPVPARSLAASLADWDDEVSVERVQITLQHVHLPKLQAVGFVDYDSDADDVALRDEANRPLALLGAVPVDAS